MNFWHPRCRLYQSYHCVPGISWNGRHILSIKTVDFSQTIVNTYIYELKKWRTIKPEHLRISRCALSLAAHLCEISSSFFNVPLRCGVYEPRLFVFSSSLSIYIYIYIYILLWNNSIEYHPLSRWPQRVRWWFSIRSVPRPLSKPIMTQFSRVHTCQRAMRNFIRWTILSSR